MSQPQSTSEDDLLTLFFMLFGGIATGAFSFGAVLLEPMRDWMLQYHLLEQGDTVLIPFAVPRHDRVRHAAVARYRGSGPRRLGQTSTVRRSTESERNETARLLYVALTRAECHSIMAFGDPTGQNNVLSTAVDEELLTWDLPEIGDDSTPAVDEAGELRISNRRVRESGSASAQTGLPIRICAYPLSSEAPQETVPPPQSFYSHTDVPVRRLAQEVIGPPAHFTASSVGSEGIDAEVSFLANLGEPLVDKGGKDWDRIGDAVHAYLGLPLASLSEATVSEAAERILDRWNAGTVLSAEVLAEIGRRWTAWIEATFPGAEVLTEQPIAWRNENDQAMEGWIDVLLKLPNGDHILVDHKTYPGTDPIGHIRENYLGQLATYSRAIAPSVGRPSQVLVHMPLLSTVIAVRTFPRSG